MEMARLWPNLYIRKDYKLGYQIRVSIVFYQKQSIRNTLLAKRAAELWVYT